MYGNPSTRGIRKTGYGTIILLLLTMNCGLTSFNPFQKESSNDFLSGLFAGLSTSTAGQPSGPTQSSAPVPTGTSSARMIIAEEGGVVSLGDEVSLTIPPGSLSADTEISITKIAKTPEAGGVMQGYAGFGQAYRFGPAGTKFNLSKPAVLSMKYDATNVESRGLKAETMQMYYFDEELNQYVNVASYADTSSGRLVARLEHFTMYLPQAQILAAGNVAPFVAIQTPVPRTIRAGIPIYLRATARDYSSGGAIADVTVCYRKLQPAAGPLTCARMKPEKRLQNLDTYVHLVPASFLSVADLGAGNDFEYTITATDNLGATTTATVQHEIIRFYQAGTLQVLSGSQNMAAGFQRPFQARARDNFGANVPFIPENPTVVGGIGTILRTDADGIVFRAENVLPGGAIQVTLGADTAQAPVTVFLGEIERLAFLDDNGLEIDNILMREGQVKDLDMSAFDAFGNRVPVLPSFTADTSIGRINSDGQFYSLDGANLGQITASLGGLIAQLPVMILSRVWGSSTEYHENPAQHVPEIEVINGVISATYINNNGVLQSSYLSQTNAGMATIHRQAVYQGSPAVAMRTAQGVIQVKHLQGNTWVTLSNSLNFNPTAVSGEPELIADGNNLYAGWRERDGSGGFYTFVKRWDGTAWTQLGGSVHNSGANIGIGLAVVNGTLYALVKELTPPSNHELFLKRWNGTSWVSVGGSLNDVSTQDVANARLYSNNGVLYATWRESAAVDEVRVKYWDGSAWIALGGALNVSGANNAGAPRMAFYNGTPYVLFREFNSVTLERELYLKHWNGTAWVQDGGTISSGPDSSGVTGDVAFQNGDPVVLYRGDDPGTHKVLSKKFQ